MFIKYLFVKSFSVANLLQPKMFWSEVSLVSFWGSGRLPCYRQVYKMKMEINKIDHLGATRSRSVAGIHLTHKQSLSA